jgi:hypothetical protein
VEFVGVEARTNVAFLNANQQRSSPRRRKEWRMPAVALACSATEWRMAASLDALRQAARGADDDYVEDVCGYAHMGNG